MNSEIGLTEVQRTLLGPLRARALDARGQAPILGDRAAAEVLERLDLDPTEIRVNPADVRTLSVRAKALDDWAAGFLAEHPDAVVLHLGCGLDSRAFRLQRPAGVTWYDIDLDEVIELRRRVLPEQPESYHLLAASVTDADWLQQIPVDQPEAGATRPVLIIAEGLTMFLTRDQVETLLRRLADRFADGAIIFDAVQPWVPSAVRLSGFWHKVGAGFRSGVGDPYALEARIGGLRLRSEQSIPALVSASRPAEPLRTAFATAERVPPLRDALRLLRYDLEPQPRIAVDLDGPQATMLATLYLRALDARAAEPILADDWADAAVRRLDVDFTRFKVSRNKSASVAIRARELDDRVRAALRPEMTVLHLGCGLDSRYQRIAPPDSVQWYDIDLPDVIDLRRRLEEATDAPAARAPQRHLLDASVTDPDLLDDIPADRPLLVVAEGLTMYLTEAEGIALFRRIIGHAPSGELIFDAFNRLGVAASNVANPPVVVTGSRLHWAIDDPEDLAARLPGLRLVAEHAFTDDPVLRRYPAGVRLLLRAWSEVPVLRRMGRVLQYRFDHGRAFDHDHETGSEEGSLDE